MGNDKIFLKKITNWFFIIWGVLYLFLWSYVILVNKFNFHFRSFSIFFIGNQERISNFWLLFTLLVFGLGIFDLFHKSKSKVILTMTIFIGLSLAHLLFLFFKYDVVLFY